MPRLTPLILGAMATLAACGSASAPITFDDTLPPDTTLAVEVYPVVSSTLVSQPATSRPGATGSSPSDDATTSSAPESQVGPPVPPVGSLPEVTSLPTTTAQPGDSSDTSSHFPYPSLFEVPQLGDDPVRGSGCGLERGLGDAIPDGLWYGLVSRGGRAATLDFDVVCAYYGDSALQAGAAPGLQELFYPVNQNSRTRQIEMAENFVWRAGKNEPSRGCVDPGPIADQSGATLPSGTAAWVAVSDGKANLVITFCG